MGVQNTISVGITTAFRLLGDLKEPARFKRHTKPPDFDFGTQSIKKAPTELVDVEVVVVEDNKNNSAGRNTRKLTLLYKTSDVGDLAVFDNVELRGFIWSISEPPLSSTGHCSYVTVHREVKRE